MDSFSCALLLLPGAASAQSSITGVVRDTSGAVLPGVTVEASGLALIEGSRTAVTDNQGAYRVVDLRPGVYTVSFTLSGFSTLRREGLDLPAEFTATVNGDLVNEGFNATADHGAISLQAEGTEVEFRKIEIGQLP